LKEKLKKKKADEQQRNDSVAERTRDAAMGGCVCGGVCPGISCALPGCVSRVCQASGAHAVLCVCVCVCVCVCRLTTAMSLMDKENAGTVPQKRCGSQRALLAATEGIEANGKQRNECMRAILHRLEMNRMERWEEAEARRLAAEVAREEAIARREEALARKAEAEKQTKLLEALVALLYERMRT
jgi:hypothetical protein